MLVGVYHFVNCHTYPLDRVASCHPPNHLITKSGLIPPYSISSVNVSTVYSTIWIKFKPACGLDCPSSWIIHLRFLISFIIAPAARDIIKLIKQNKWMIQEDGQSNPQAGLNLIQTVLYTVLTLTLLIEWQEIRPDLVIRLYGGWQLATLSNGYVWQLTKWHRHYSIVCSHVLWWVHETNTVPTIPRT